MAVVTACRDFGAQEKKIHHCFHFVLLYLQKVMGLDAMVLIFLNVEF